MEQNASQNVKLLNTLMLKIKLVNHVIKPAQTVMDLLLKIAKLVLMDTFWLMEVA